MKIQRIINHVIYLAVFLLRYDARTLSKLSEYKTKTSIELTKKAGKLGEEALLDSSKSQKQEQYANDLNSFINKLK